MSVCYPVGRFSEYFDIIPSIDVVSQYSLYQSIIERIGFQIFMQRIRILYLINNLEIGGAEIALANLVNQLPPDLYDIWVGGLVGLGSIKDRFRLSSERMISFHFFRRFPIIDLLAFFRLFLFLRKQHIQIMHSSLLLPNTIGRAAAWLAGVPIIISTEQSTYDQKRIPWIIADKCLSIITSQLIAISQAVKVFASTQAHISQNKFIVLYHGISLDRLRVLSSKARREKRLLLGVSDSQPVIISVGRLSIEKGHRFLLDAARRVLLFHPNVKFLIVGDGPCKSSLQQQARRNGLDEHVLFLGFRHDVYDLLQISTIMTLPSLREGLGVALLEAAACHLPIVASNVGGVPEIVSNGINGILVPPGDSLGMAQALLELLGSPKLGKRMGREGRKIVEERFSDRAVAEETSKLYLHLWSKQITKNKGQ